MFCRCRELSGAFRGSRKGDLGVTVVGIAQIQPGETANEPHRKVVAAVPRSWPPQYSLVENGKPIGFAIDVMDEIAARAGLTVEYVVVENISAAGEMLNRGHVDLVPNSGIVPERVGAAGTPPAAFPLRPAIPLGGRFSPFAPWPGALRPLGPADGGTALPLTPALAAAS